ncbi:MAG: hypothetical protein LUQ65_12175 [Candidatus Helarchaeota archaeon]|nr:hypothetical protein [Candidatus Helarchaeota archaeon]
MTLETAVIPYLIKDIIDIYEASIDQEATDKIDFRELRFNLARFLMDLHEESGKLPYKPDKHLCYYPTPA